MSFKVRNEWLCEEDGRIAERPLSFWFEYFEIKPMEVNGCKCYWKAEATDKEIKFRGAVLIEAGGGYALNHQGYECYKDELFFIDNADLDTPKLRYKG